MEQKMQLSDFLVDKNTRYKKLLHLKKHKGF